MSQLPREVRQLMGAQWGLVTRTQLLGRGWGVDAVRGWVRGDRLERVHRGVYRAPGSAQPPEQPVLAAVLRAGPGARAGGRTSCALHQLEGFVLRGPPEVVVPSARAVTGVSFLVKATLVEAPEQTTVRGVPALSAARALIEVASAIDERMLRVAIDSARGQRLLSVRWLQRRADALETHHGARIVARVLSSGVMRPESEGERTLAGVVKGIEPEPEWGISDLVPGRRLDLGWRLALFGLEYDGRDHHVLPTDRDADGVRDLESLVSGVVILRVTAGMIREQPERTRALIEAILRRRLGEMATLRDAGLLHVSPTRS
ncbi:MAG: hypothetical protein ACRDYX_03545 [Egibacteraceae bacterium]